jgi:hypothetical protein
MPCRGTGRLISNLGGTQKTITCPWCRGGGVRLPGIDAQADAPEGDDLKSDAPQADAPSAKAPQEDPPEAA